MFVYSEKNLFDRCGAIDTPYSPKKTTPLTGNNVIIDGEKIPVMSFKSRSGVKFTRCICLKTFLGYIPIDKIYDFSDIFDKTKYLTDETEWTFGYSSEKATQKDRENVKKLSLSLGKHWKS